MKCAIGEMDERNIRVVWSDEAKSDLRDIYNQVKRYASSSRTARNVTKDILDRSRGLRFTEQYEADEQLGEPFCRIYVRTYKLVYKVQSENEIRILSVFDTRRNPLSQKRLY
ncbi:MAG: type II toxin-antitoxin system RelE/ParE family toxin [Flavobacteriia bacterium]|nr:type II toxin-antitoxin system RelE/ParE family toxin [Flavobacteriia bacterium]